MNHDLIERYIYAVTRRLPKKQQEDVSMELRSLIGDMLEERCVDRPAEERDVRVVLTELGNPEELSARYREDGPKCLLGQPYYDTYCIVMKLVWIAVAVGMGVSSLILMLLDQWTPLEMLGNFLANTMQGLLSAFAVVTLLFVFLERRGVSVHRSLDELPPVPKKTQEIPLWESLTGIVFCVIFLVIFLWVPEVMGFVVDDSGAYVPLFDVQALRDSWPCIAVFGILGIAGESVKLIERRYTKKVLAATMVTNVLSGAVAVAWLAGGGLFSRAYQSKMQELFAGQGFLESLMGNFHLFFLGILLFALAMDTAEAAYRTLYGDR